MQEDANAVLPIGASSIGGVGSLGSGGLSRSNEAADLLAGLTATDPELLAVAKEALIEYFQRHTDLRRSFNDVSGG